MPGDHLLITIMCIFNTISYGTKAKDRFFPVCSERFPDSDYQRHCKHTDEPRRMWYSNGPDANIF